MSSCRNRRCLHEWCDRNRKECNALVRLDAERVTTCDKPTTWLAPLRSRAFPLAYCAAHAPAIER